MPLHDAYFVFRSWWVVHLWHKSNAEQVQQCFFAWARTVASDVGPPSPMLDTSDEDSFEEAD